MSGAQVWVPSRGIPIHSATTPEEFEALFELAEEKERGHGLDPQTMIYQGPSPEESRWSKLDIPFDYFMIVDWMRLLGITKWWWRDSAPDRMVHRYEVRFENPDECALFDLAWPYSLGDAKDDRPKFRYKGK